MRIHAHDSHLIAGGGKSGFAAITNLEHWLPYLARIIKPSTPKDQVVVPLRRNLGYRLQLMEFEAAMLIYCRESIDAAGKPTLHSSVLALKIHQHATLCNAVFEGIGSHLYRASRRAEGRTVSDSRVREPLWQGALLTAAYPDKSLRKAENAKARIEAVGEWRDRLHLDRPRGDLDYNAFTLPGCFVPTYITFHEVMTNLNANWPSGTVLNEVLPA